MKTTESSPGSRKRFARLLDPYEQAFFGGMLLVVMGAWVFIAVASRVVAGDTQTLDRRIFYALRDPDNPAKMLGPPELQEVGRDLTALGGYACLVLLLVGVSGFLILSRRVQMLRFLLASVLSGYLMQLGLKSLFERARPPTNLHYLSHVDTYSFPSGHSMMSMIVFFTLGALLARISKTRRLKVYCLTFAVLISLLVGVSRVYLGVHWPTDVLAGWSAGIVWATLSCLFAGWLERKGVIGLHETPKALQERERSVAQ